MPGRLTQGDHAPRTEHTRSGGAQFQAAGSEGSNAASRENLGTSRQVCATNVRRPSSRCQGHDFRLEADIVSSTGKVYVRWLGTHAGYDEWNTQRKREDQQPREDCNRFAGSESRSAALMRQADSARRAPGAGAMRMMPRPRGWVLNPAAQTQMHDVAPGYSRIERSTSTNAGFW